MVTLLKGEQDTVEVVTDCNAEQIVDVPVPRIREEVIQHTPQDRISNRSSEQTIDIPIRQIQEKIVEVIQLIQLILQERISERIGAKLASRIQEKLLEVIQLIRQERIQECIVEGISDVPIP